MENKKYVTNLGIVKFHSSAKLPTQNIDDIGFDVYSVEDLEIPHLSIGKVDLGIGFATNPSYPKDLKGDHMASLAVAHDERWSLETKIEGRSGLASRGIFPIGGEIDPSYRNSIIVCLINLSGETYHVKKGDKVAQLVIRPVLANTKNHHVEFVFRDGQDVTERNKKGFGSSGR
jgi:dUTPase